MNRRLILPAAILLALVLLPAGTVKCADSEETYASTDSIFTIGTGARPLGLGDAFVGLADDENAMLYNPAGMAFSDNCTVGSFYTNQYNSLNYGSVNYAGKHLGLTYLQLSSPTLTATDLYGNPTGEFNYTSRGFIAALVHRIDNLGIAFQGKIYNKDEALGYSLSPALLYKMAPFQFGLIAKNLLSTDIVYTEDYTEPWRKELTMGIAYNTKHLKIDLDLDAHFDDRGINPGVARIGAEGVVFENITLRAGLDSTLQSSIGLSLKLNHWKLDYSYQIHSELPSTHRVSISLEFDIEKLYDGDWVPARLFKFG